MNPHSVVATQCYFLSIPLSVSWLVCFSLGGYNVCFGVGASYEEMKNSDQFKLWGAFIKLSKDYDSDKKWVCVLR